MPDFRQRRRHAATTIFASFELILIERVGGPRVLYWTAAS